MPLPESNTPWPPPGLAKPHQDIAGWAAWWSGDPEELARHYGGTADRTVESSFKQDWNARGGLIGTIQRFFWGQRTKPGEQRAKLHMPTAGEIAAVSADLLFAAPPKITSKDAATQEALDRCLGERAHTTWHESAEAGAALGHSWLRVGIDRDVVQDKPIISAVDADAAVGTYSYGHLREVTFLSEFQATGGVVWRHLERHAVADGRGYVEHGLYCGDAFNLGQRMSLEDHDATHELAGLVAEIALTGGIHGIATGLDRLDVVGISNARSRTWRRRTEARDLGRADISGVEGALDALDDTWSSWMRDIRHGRSRIHVPQEYLQSLGPGKGSTVDIDAEVYVGVESMPSADGGLEMSATQFAIRWQEHERTAAVLLERILSGAGYSPQTFGLADVAALTAMESWSRQIRTQSTRSGKIRRWRQGLLELSEIVLAYDRTQFSGKHAAGAPIEVTFTESVSESQQARAQTAQLLKAAGAASTKTLVALQHPDWDAEQIKAEVALIQDESRIDIGSPIDAFADMEDTPGGGPEEDEEGQGDDPEGEDPEDDSDTPPEDDEGEDGPARPSPFARRRTRPRGAAA